MNMALIVVVIVALASGALAGAGRWQHERSIDKYSDAMTRLRELTRPYSVAGDGHNGVEHPTRSVLVRPPPHDPSGDPGRLPGSQPPLNARWAAMPAERMDLEEGPSGAGGSPEGPIPDQPTFTGPVAAMAFPRFDLPSPFAAEVRTGRRRR